MATTVILDENQLRQLAAVTYYQEVRAIHDIPFQSPIERDNYLNQCRANHDSVLALLDSGKALRHQFGDADPRAPIAHDVFSYAVYCCNSALQTVRNYALRTNYLTKIREHADRIIKALTELEVAPTNAVNVRRLAKDAVMYRNNMLEYTRRYQSPASRNFSKWVKETGMSFQDLVKKYQIELGYRIGFSELEKESQLKVYNRIIEASGRGNLRVNLLVKSLGIAGIAVLLFTAGMMVWDIFSSQHVIETAVRDTVMAAGVVATFGGALLGEVIGTALASGAGCSTLSVMMAGFASGIAGAFIIGAFIGWMVDMIFGSGGQLPSSTEGHRCYVAEMPDAMVLARQIAHA